MGNSGSGFMDSMKSRLIAFMVLICVVPLATAIIISFISTKSVSKDSAEELNLKQAELVEQSFIDNINANFRAMEQVASAPSTREFIKDATDEDKFNAMVAHLQSVDEKFGDGNSTVVTGVDGENLARSKGNFTNIFDREYFQQAIKGNIFLSELSVSKTTGARIIVPAAPIFDEDGSVIGIITRNYDVDYLYETLVNEAKEGQSIYILGKDGKVVATSTQEIGPEDEIDMSTGAVFKKIQAGQTSGSFIDTSGKKCVTSFVQEPFSGWTIIISTEYDVIMAATQKSSIILLVIGLVLAAVAVVVAIAIGNAINRPISSIDESLGLLAEGEFKNIEVYSGRRDEFGAMIRNVNSVIDRLRDIVTAIRGTADSLSEDSNGVAQTASEISGAMTGVSDAVQEIAQGAIQQADEIQQATENIQVISGNIDGVTGDAENLAKTAQVMDSDSRSSASELKDLEKSSDQMGKSIERITSVIAATSHAVDSISVKVAAIDEIASQTSLLSLNASIEAARAGEAGRGFAVVAEEIGKLAMDSANSANEIKEEMEKLLAQAQEAVKVAEDVARSNQQQHATIGNTVDSIQNLIGGIQTTVNGVENINSNALACNESKVVVVDAMTNISAISEENAASTEHTSATIQELNATVDALAEEAADLREHAETLMGEMQFFKF